MSVQQTGIAKLDGIEQKILRLAPLQAELRRAAQAYLSAHAELTANAFAVQAHGTWVDVTSFLTGKRALGKGRFLTGLTALINRHDLLKRIEQHTDGIQDRCISVSLFSESAIRTLFKVLKGHERRKKTVTRALFSNAFVPYHETVLKLFDLGQACQISVEALVQRLPKD
jgi:hypothetical protein